MCTTCGCGEGDTRIEGAAPAIHEHADGTVPARPRRDEDEHAGEDLAPPAGMHWHRHADGTLHSHVHGGGTAHPQAPAAAWLGAVQAAETARERTVRIEQDILAKNDAYARENRKYFADRGIFALNLVSSPGSGKTTLLVRTIEAWQGRTPIAVIEGDQQTSRDADRVRSTGAAAIQINTGKGCHLDAHMVGQALEELEPADGSLLLVENVGNLVCPAAFDLGEAHKVVILSATEGDDKPLKYPDMFRAADLMLVNKADLLPYVRFDVDAAIDYARRMRPGLESILVSAETGQGFEAWLAWLERGVAAARKRRDENLELLRRRIAQLEAQLAGRPSAAATGA